MMTESKQAKILERVRGLLAKAASTEFEEERKTFLAKADELMEIYAIDQAMLLLADDVNAKLVTKHSMSLKWMWEMTGVDWDAVSSIYWLWESCVRHCRCVSPGYNKMGQDANIWVYGTESDLAYLDLLFTDLYLQLSGTIRPTFNPSAEIGSQVRIAKEAGMTWDQILDWTGLRDDPLGKRLLPAYRRHCEKFGLAQVKISPKTYQLSFVQAFCSTIRSRLMAMKQQREGGSSDTGSMALVIRNIEDQARDEMYGDFPDLRPHPQGCTCKACDARRKAKMPARRSRAHSYAAASQGSQAGQAARIATNDAQIKSRKQIS
jgi:hypothetical protein